MSGSDWLLAARVIGVPFGPWYVVKLIGQNIPSFLRMSADFGDFLVWEGFSFVPAVPAFPYGLNVEPDPM